MVLQSGDTDLFFSKGPILIIGSVKLLQKALVSQLEDSAG